MTARGDQGHTRTFLCFAGAKRAYVCAVVVVRRSTISLTDLVGSSFSPTEAACALLALGFRPHRLFSVRRDRAPRALDPMALPFSCLATCLNVAPSQHELRDRSALQNRRDGQARTNWASSVAKQNLSIAWLWLYPQQENIFCEGQWMWSDSGTF